MTNKQRTPKGLGKDITAQRVERYELFDNLEQVRSHYTEQDRKVAEQLEATELLREFLATEL